MATHLQQQRIPGGKIAVAQQQYPGEQRRSQAGGWPADGDVGTAEKRKNKPGDDR